MRETNAESAGRYRRWDGVTLRGTVLFSTRPLAVTRLNDAGAAVVTALETETFETPTSVAAETGMEVEAVARLLERLHRRGFLEWAPCRDESHLPPVSIVVTVRNERDAIGDCLDALAALDYPAYEVVLVDDGSTDGTCELARDHRLADSGRLRLLTVGSSAEPLGIGASRNRGVDVARYDIIAFTDADCRPRSDWLSTLAPCLADHDIVGGRVQPCGTDSVDAYEGTNSSLDMGEYAARVDPDGATPYLPTANFLATRSTLEHVPFPERNIAEDVDVCWRAIERGFDVIYDPAGVVEHEYRDDLPSFAGRRSDYGASEALLARTYRHGEKVSLPTGALLVVAVLALLVGQMGFGGPRGQFVAIATVVLTAIVSVTVSSVSRYRPVRSTTPLGAFLRSRARESLSRAYAVSKEVTRYYSLPLSLIAIGLFGVGRTTAAAVGLTVIIATVALPAIVEYGIEKPSLPPSAYLRYYLADHLGYQCGVYRGIATYRTLAHLSPMRRFRLVGPFAAVSTSAIGAVASALRSRSNVRTISVGGVEARFRAETSAEIWWFDDEALRGDRCVLVDLLERLEPSDAFLDVGANVGQYACFTGAVLRDGRVIAVEPQPANADRLVANLELNDIDAHVVRRALGAANGGGRLAVPDDRAGAGTSTLVPDADGTSAESTDANRFDINVVAGDTLIERGDWTSPTVVKIDVEGAELDVLRGLEGTLSRSDCRLVYCEVHPTLLGAFDTTPDDVESTLRDRGFVLERIQEWEHRYLLRATRSADGHEPGE